MSKKKIVLVITVGAALLAAALFTRFSASRDQGGLQLSGTVEVTEVNVGFKVPGRISVLLTDEGRQVREGERVAELDSAELRSLVAQNRASLENGEAQFDKARADLERYTKLFEKGVISPQQMDSARTAFSTARSQLRMGQASLQTAEVRLKDAVIHAPMNGVVLRKNCEAGETVSAGTPVVTIGDLAHPWVKVYVKEDKLGLVKLGQKAEVSVDSFPGRRFDGTITFIAAEAEFTPKNVQTKEERVKLVFAVKVSVENRNAELKPGMPADVLIPAH